MKPPPPELCFGRTIYIDCSVWKSKRVMQRKIAEELKLDQKIMDMFDKQDEEDDFSGVVHDSRDVIRKVSAVIDRTLRESRFMMIFLNGSDDELVLSRFGIPEYHDCLIIWTFKRRFLTMYNSNDSKTRDKLRYTDLFVFGNTEYHELTSSESRALFREEAATIFSRYTCMQDVNPTMAADCCLYGLFLHHVLHGTTRFGWAAQTPSLYICDGILQGSRATEISNELHREISFKCDDASILDSMYRRLLHEDPEIPSLVIKDDDVYGKRPYRWISVTSKNKEVQEDMPTLLARASSVILAFERTNSPPGLPTGLFKQCSKLGVLILSYCAFSYVSPPFLHCDTLRFLGLDHCTDDNTVGLEGDSATKWTCLHSLWVLDLRYTDWGEILSEEKIGLMANIRELNLEGVGCWQYYASKLQERLPYLQRLRIIKPVCQAEAAADINNSFVSKAKLEILDLSGNTNMKYLPTSLSKARRLQLLVLDGCDGLESVMLPKSSLRSFSFDGYGPASYWTSIAELPTESSRSKPNADGKDVKISTISLEGCTQLENLFLRGLHNLVELDLSGCVLIKVLDLGTMIVDVPGLKRLFLLGCENLCAIKWGFDIKSRDWGSIPNFPMELELLCIDTRPTARRSKLQSSLALAQHKSFQLQVHAITADARLARSLWAPLHYFLQDKKNDVYFNISITSSTGLCGDVIQPEAATSKEMNGPSCRRQHGHVVASAGLYGDVFAKVGDAQAPMQAFPQPPTGQLDHHVEIGDRSHSVESEMVIDYDHWNLGDLMRSLEFPELTDIHLHDLPALEQISEFKMIASSLEAIKIRGCWSLRRLPHLSRDGASDRRPAVEVEKDVWDTLKWDGVAAGHHPSLYQAPVHSRYYKRRMLRRTVLR
ncbi:hypothetical protein BAE44_0010599, partial [Dichanthelium oligosanthes]